MTRLGSVNLAVRDIAACEKFYTEKLGLTVDPDRTNRPSFVLLRGANCMLILQQADSPGFEIAFEVEDVAALKAKLGDRAEVQQMGWGNAIETTDPEGNRLNFYQWT